jgi:hypothetical protein
MGFIGEVNARVGNCKCHGHSLFASNMSYSNPQQKSVI